MINRLGYLTLTKGISFTERERENNETKRTECSRFSYTRSFRLWYCL